MWNVVSYHKGETRIEDIWESTEKKFWTEETGTKLCLKKIPKKKFNDLHSSLSVLTGRGFRDMSPLW